MPRLRTLKNYDPITNFLESDEQQESNEFEDVQTTNEFRQERGWWSNSNIISSFTDAKLRASILYYKELIVSLETELVAREHGYLQTHSLDIAGMHRVGARILEASTKTKSRHTKLEVWLKRNRELSLRQSAEIEEAWSQILKEFYTK